MIGVLHVIETLHPGGAEHLLLDTVKHMNGEKFKSVVVALFGPDDVKSIPENVEYVNLNLKSRYSFLKGIKKLYHIMKHEKISIVHTHLYFANVYGRIAAKIARTPVIMTTLHNADYTFESKRTPKFFFRKQLDRFTGKYFNREFIAVSEFVRLSYEKHMPFKKAIVLPNAVETRKFCQISNEKKESVRKELDILPHEIFILGIGRLHPQKGFIYLFDAFKRLSSTYPQAKLIILGKGPLKNTLTRYCRTHKIDNVFFVGTKEDVASIMSAADVFILPSVYEGLPIVILEAMSSGIPIISTDIPSVSCVIEDMREGILVEPKSSEALYNALDFVMENRDAARRFGERAQVKALNSYDIHKYVSNLENIYDSTCA